MDPTKHSEFKWITSETSKDIQAEECVPDFHQRIADVFNYIKASESKKPIFNFGHWFSLIGVKNNLILTCYTNCVLKNFSAVKPLSTIPKLTAGTSLVVKWTLAKL